MGKHYYLQTKYFTTSDENKLEDMINGFLRKLVLSSNTQVVYLPAEVHPVMDDEYNVWFSAYIVYNHNDLIVEEPDDEVEEVVNTLEGGENEEPPNIGEIVEATAADMNRFWSLAAKEGVHLYQNCHKFLQDMPNYQYKAPEELQLFVWEGFSPDYTDGLAFALASDEVEARKIIEKEMDYCPSEWGILSIHPLNESFGKAVSGGG